MIRLRKLFYIALTSAVFGFIFLVGYKIQAGVNISDGGYHGIMKIVVDILSVFVEVFGTALAGGAIMIVALFAGIFAAVTIWRDKLYFY